MAAIEVPTFEQIATILSQLATNYSNIFADYYNLFYNPTPMDVTVQIYDEAGNLTTITIPNRAKDRAYILNGNGDPNNSVLAPKGSVYQDLTNGAAYIKQFANTDNTGWSEFMTLDSLEDYLIQGVGSPEGEVAASKGILYVDKTNAALYLKSTATGNTGWIIISANASNLANRDLSNLTETGEAHFANPSLSNLNAAGTNLINSKENISNKVTTINSSSTDIQYPSAKATYNLVDSSTSNLANKSLSNLNTTGEDKFVHTETQARDCIFKAPNGLLSVSGNVISLSSGTVLLCANGVNSSNQAVNEKVVTASTLSISVSWTSAGNGVVFFDGTTNALNYKSESEYFRQIVQPTVTTTNAMWYNPSTNKYKVTSNTGSTWTAIKAVEIGRFSTNSSGDITSFYSYHPMTVAMEDDIWSLKDEVRRELKKRDDLSIGVPQVTLDFTGTLPENCIDLNGAAVSRTTYANLFAIYGTTYGAGDGSTTFNLPDCRDKVFWGGETAGYVAAGLPNITGSFFCSDIHSGSFANGAFQKDNVYTAQEGGGGSGLNDGGINFDASRSSSVYKSDVTTVQPPALKVRVYTRYQ